jgi:hypothetical protein
MNEYTKNKTIMIIKIRDPNYARCLVHNSDRNCGINAAWLEISNNRSVANTNVCICLQKKHPKFIVI